MSVVSVYQIPDDSGDLDFAKLEQSITFRVIVDDPGDSPAVALSAPGIPQPSEMVGANRVVSLSYRRDINNPTIFDVTAKLTSALPDQEQKPSGAEKVNVSIKVSTVIYDEPVYMDKDKKPIANTAGQPFSNQPTKTYYDERITVSFRTGKVDQQNIDQCRGAINSDPITLTVKGYPRQFAAKTLKLVDTPISSVVVEKDYNWDVEYVMEYRKDTWQRNILNMGRIQKINGKILPIYVGQQITTEDVPLDKNGKAIVDGNVTAAKKVADAAAGERCYLTFPIESEVSFGGLLRGVK